VGYALATTAGVGGRRRFPHRRSMQQSIPEKGLPRQRSSVGEQFRRATPRHGIDLHSPAHLPGSRPAGILCSSVLLSLPSPIILSRRFRVLVCAALSILCARRVDSSSDEVAALFIELSSFQDSPDLQCAKGRTNSSCRP